MPDAFTPTVLRGADLPEMGWIGRHRFDLTRWREPVNDDFRKPAGGLWLSPLTPHGSEWSWWLEDSGYAGDYFLYDVQLDADAEFLVIDSLADFRQLLELFPATVAPERRLALELCKQSTSFLDFEAIAKRWSGVFLTHRGEAETRRPVPGAPLLSVPSLYGWDIASLVVLRRAAIVGVSAPMDYRVFSEEELEEIYSDRW